MKSVRIGKVLFMLGEQEPTGFYPVQTFLIDNVSIGLHADAKCSVIVPYDIIYDEERSAVGNRVGDLFTVWFINGVLEPVCGFSTLSVNIEEYLEGLVSTFLKITYRNILETERRQAPEGSIYTEDFLKYVASNKLCNRYATTQFVLRKFVDIDEEVLQN